MGVFLGSASLLDSLTLGYPARVSHFLFLPRGFTPRGQKRVFAFVSVPFSVVAVAMLEIRSSTNGVNIMMATHSNARSRQWAKC